MFNNIPAELRALDQWVIWKYENVGSKKSTKVPYDPKGYVTAKGSLSRFASVNETATWSSFEMAVDRFNTGDCDGIGFVFTDSDPYTFLDLDNPENDIVAQERQVKIFKEFNSYSEVSPSGKGLHIIIKGKVPTGRRRSFVEVYSSQRYATMTGNVYHNRPIEDRNELLTALYEQMGSGDPAKIIYQGDDKERYTDEEIITQAKAASNGEKFNELFSGNWQNLYPSQSEADYAIIDIVAFYTQNKNQIARIFKRSQLGRRDKAKRQDYISWMINKSFDRMLPPLDLDAFKNGILNNLIKPINDHPIPISSIPISSITPPPGLLGELAQFIYYAAPRPVPEIALAAAIGLMAGICGRAYNISGTGLNQYVLVLAKTGSGKESAASGIDRLMNAIKIEVPSSIDFRGPGIINSGQALAKYIGMVSHSFVSVLGEFGIRLENMSAPNATSAEKTLKMLLLDLYNKSGKGQTIQANIYSSKDESVGVFESPAFSLLGESTPERFYSVLNEMMITEGLLPRFTIIEYKGKRPEFNENHGNVEVPKELKDKLVNLTAWSLTLSHAKPRRICDVQQSEEALKITRAFDKFADEKINKTDNDAIAELWNRAHMKVLKLSALVAVGVNYLQPLIIPEYVNWAINIITSDINALSTKFDAGEVGEKETDESKQIKDMIKHIKEFLENPWDKIEPYCRSCHDLYEAKIIPYEYLMSRTAKLSSYRKDKSNGGATNALKKNLQSLIDIGKLEERTKDQNILNKFGTGRRVFTVNSRLFK